VEIGRSEMKKRGYIYIAFLLLCLAPSTASAADIKLFDWAFNIDGVTIETPAVPVGFDGTTGLGTWTIAVGPSGGDHYAIGFFDHDIGDYWDDEFGYASGAVAEGQSWEIDDPFGDIYIPNLMAGTLDNSNSVPGDPVGDVSMALGWDFALGVNEKATIQFHLEDSLPTDWTGFYLRQTDRDSQASIYFWSELDIRVGVIPEPGTIILVFSGLGLAAAARFRKLR
jgi:hypothetical protein